MLFHVNTNHLALERVLFCILLTYCSTCYKSRTFDYVAHGPVLMKALVKFRKEFFSRTSQKIHVAVDTRCRIWVWITSWHACTLYGPPVGRLARYRSVSDHHPRGRHCYLISIPPLCYLPAAVLPPRRLRLSYKRAAHITLCCYMTIQNMKSLL
jgi:hypothetical protein